MITNAMYRLSQQAVSGISKQAIIPGGYEQQAAVVLEKELQDQIMFWFGMGDLSTFFKNGVLNNDMLVKAYAAIEPYRQGLASEDVYRIISRVMLNNENSGLTLSQQTMVLAGMNRLLQQGLLGVGAMAPATLQPVSGDLELSELQGLMPEEGALTEFASLRAPALQKYINFQFGGDLSYLISSKEGELLDQTEVAGIFAAIKEYASKASVSNEEAYRMIRKAIATNYNTGISVEQEEAIDDTFKNLLQVSQ